MQYHKPVNSNSRSHVLLNILSFKITLVMTTSSDSFLLPAVRWAQRMTYMKRAMIAALMSPEMGTVTNHAMKIFLNNLQSTDFLDRSHPTATTEPTCVCAMYTLQSKVVPRASKTRIKQLVHDDTIAWNSPGYALAATYACFRIERCSLTPVF